MAENIFMVISFMDVSIVISGFAFLEVRCICMCTCSQYWKVSSNLIFCL